MKNDLTGLGKATQDVRMSEYIYIQLRRVSVLNILASVETTVSQRRELDSERQTKETEEQRKYREVRRISVIPCGR